MSTVLQARVDRGHLVVYALLGRLRGSSLTRCRSDAAILLCGVFLGSFGWWCVLAGTVAVIDARLDPRVIRALDLTAGAAMGTLALVALRRL